MIKLGVLLVVLLCVFGVCVFLERKVLRPLADQRIAAAKGEAQAIELEGRALRSNPEVLRLRAINALNPKAQIIFCNTGDCPSILGGSFTAAPTTGK